MFETSSDLILYQDNDVHDLLFPGEPGSAGCGGGMSLSEALLPLVESPTPPLIPWMCSTRYKTELCSRYAAMGFCKYAERCQFAHGLHDLHVPSRHPKYKTELCRAFHTAGYCVYGTRCLFAHNAKEQRPACRRRRNIPCRTYRSFGVCPFGTRCNFLHVEVSEGRGLSDGGLESPDCASEGKAAVTGPRQHSQDWRPRGPLCRTFSSFGFCLYGTRCRFQHGLPNTIRGPDSAGNGASRLSGVRACSPASDMFSFSPCSSLSSSPPSGLPSPVWPEDSSPPLTTALNEPMAHNAFTFSSQLNEMLLPLALRLQQLENSQSVAVTCAVQDVWENKLQSL